jgi:NAD-dependent DNA ligase
MTREEIILQKKATALNAIRKLYHPLTKHSYTYYEGEGSRMEQISFDVESIIQQLEKELLELKQKG